MPYRDMEFLPSHLVSHTCYMAEGPYCLKFRFYIHHYHQLDEWIKQNMKFQYSGCRIKISADDRFRNSYYPEFYVFFETKEQATFFKLHWCGKDKVESDD